MKTLSLVFAKLIAASFFSCLFAIPNLIFNWLNMPCLPNPDKISFCSSDSWETNIDNGSFADSTSFFLGRCFNSSFLYLGLREKFLQRTITLWPQKFVRHSERFED